MEKRLAVIVPGYNCEKYIRKCLNSLVAQLSENDQVFFIDDGSTDLTANIVKNEFQKVRYIYQKNAGVSAARNHGLDCAIDFKYIMFVDSDDWIEDDCINKFHLNEVTADYTFCDWIEYKKSSSGLNGVVSEKVCIDKEYDESVTIYDVRKHFIRFRSGGSPWGKLFKNSIIQRNNIRFIQNLPYAEDYLFNLEYLKYAESVEYIKDGLYAYNCLSEGARVKFRKNRCDLTIQIESYKAQLYDENHSLYAPLIKAAVVEQVAVAFLNLFDARFSKNERKQEIKKCKNFLKSRHISIGEIVLANARIKAKVICCMILL